MPARRPYAALGRRIAQRRAELRYTQAELCARLDVTQGFMSNIESGFRRPSPEILHPLARVLDIPIEELSALAGYA